MLEFWLLAGLIILGFGIAIYLTIWKHMAQRYKKPSVTIHQHHADSVDVEALAATVAKTVAETLSKNLLEKLEKMQLTSGGKKVTSEELQVAIDESIIPVTLESTVDKVNLEGMSKEETHEDTGLAAAKSKLAALKKKS